MPAEEPAVCHLWQECRREERREQDRGADPHPELGRVEEYFAEQWASESEVPGAAALLAAGQASDSVGQREEA